MLLSVAILVTILSLSGNASEPPLSHSVLTSDHQMPTPYASTTEDLDSLSTCSADDFYTPTVTPSMWSLDDNTPTPLAHAQELLTPIGIGILEETSDAYRIYIQNPSIMPNNLSAHLLEVTQTLIAEHLQTNTQILLEKAKELIANPQSAQKDFDHSFLLRIKPEVIVDQKTCTPLFQDLYLLPTPINGRLLCRFSPEEAHPPLTSETFYKGLLFPESFLSQQNVANLLSYDLFAHCLFNIVRCTIKNAPILVAKSGFHLQINWQLASDFYNIWQQCFYIPESYGSFSFLQLITDESNTLDDFTGSLLITLDSLITERSIASFHRAPILEHIILQNILTLSPNSEAHAPWLLSISGVLSLLTTYNITAPVSDILSFIEGAFDTAPSKTVLPPPLLINALTQFHRTYTGEVSRLSCEHEWATPVDLLNKFFTDFPQDEIVRHIEAVCLTVSDKDATISQHDPLSSLQKVQNTLFAQARNLLQGVLTTNSLQKLNHRLLLDLSSILNSFVFKSDLCTEDELTPDTEEPLNLQTLGTTLILFITKAQAFISSHTKKTMKDLAEHRKSLYAENQLSDTLYQTEQDLFWSQLLGSRIPEELIEEHVTQHVVKLKRTIAGCWLFPINELNTTWRHTETLYSSGELPIIPIFQNNPDVPFYQQKDDPTPEVDLIHKLLSILHAMHNGQLDLASFGELCQSLTDLTNTTEVLNAYKIREKLNVLRPNNSYSTLPRFNFLIETTQWSAQQFGASNPHLLLTRNFAHAFIAYVTNTNQDIHSLCQQAQALNQYMKEHYNTSTRTIDHLLIAASSLRYQEPQLAHCRKKIDDLQKLCSLLEPAIFSALQEPTSQE